MMQRRGLLGSGEEAMSSVHDVAAYILAREGNLSTMKLQKLCYYAQGWHLAWHGRPLYPEAIEAWRMGPVCPALYAHHRGKASVAEWKLGAADQLSPEEKSTLDVVIDFYRPLSGFDLGNRTHTERPWIQAWESVEPRWRGNVAIDVDTLHEYFTMLHKEAVQHA
jgi:uncharacterized phage-associated protein